MNGMVSTIIPVFNRPVQIVEAVKSVVDQHYRPIEIIIIDDGSTDETIDVLQGLKAQYPKVVRLHRISNGGPGSAREAGRKLAQGDYIQYLDSDDVLYPEKFKLQVDALIKNPHCQVVYGKTIYRSMEGVCYQAHGKRTEERIDSMFPSFLSSRWWSTLTPLYLKSLCDKAGPWADLKQEEDWEYDSRIASLHPGLCYVDEFVCEVRDHFDDRLSKYQITHKDKLGDVAKARQLIYRNATLAGFDHSYPEMQIFARSVFHLSRQCSALGLKEDAKNLFELSKKASGRPYKLEYVLFRLLTLALGWQNMGRLSMWRDQIRSQA